MVCEPRVMESGRKVIKEKSLNKRISVLERLCRPKVCH